MHVCVGQSPRPLTTTEPSRRPAVAGADGDWPRLVVARILRRFNPPLLKSHGALPCPFKAESFSAMGQASAFAQKENIVSPSAMSNAELVGELLAPRFGDFFNVLFRAGKQKSSYGLGACKSTSLLERKLSISRELWLRQLRSQMEHGPLLSQPQVVRDWLKLYFAGLENEVFAVLYLNSQHALIDAEALFRGTLVQTAVYPREVVKSALAHNAAAVVFCHNHPSSHQPDPSPADELLTKRLTSALELVDVRVLDHFVVGGDQIVSFAERGLL